MSTTIRTSTLLAFASARRIGVRYSSRGTLIVKERVRARYSNTVSAHKLKVFYLSYITRYAPPAIRNELLDMPLA